MISLRRRRPSRERKRLPSLFCSFSFCFFLLFASVSSVSALTREQAEQIDWSRKNLGSVSHASFVELHRSRSIPSSSSSSSTSSSSPASAASNALLVAAAEEGTIALLDAVDGEIIWRKVRQENRAAVDWRWCDLERDH